MLVTIDSPEALVETADRAYAGLGYGRRRDGLGLVLAPGMYEGRMLALRRAYDPAQVDVTISAQDARRPPAFRNAGIRVKAGAVTVRHVTFEGVANAGIQLAVHAVGDVAIEG